MLVTIYEKLVSFRIYAVFFIKYTRLFVVHGSTINDHFASKIAIYV